MGLKRESMALTEEEKEVIAYHEGGHAVLAYVLEHADPLHKVTILPTGMALGVTQQLPRGGAPHLQEGVHRRLDRRARWVAASPRRSCSGTCRPAPRTTWSGHRAGPQDGARVGHERADRADGVGLAGPGVPRRGPRAHPRLLRRDRPGHRRGGRAHPPPGGEPGPADPAAEPRGASRRSPGRCSSTRPSTATRWRASSTTRWAARSAGTGEVKRADGSVVEVKPPTPNGRRRRPAGADVAALGAARAGLLERPERRFGRRAGVAQPRRPRPTGRRRTSRRRRPAARRRTRRRATIIGMAEIS